MSRRSAPLAVGLAVVGGLTVVGATTGTWVVAERMREIGGVGFADPRTTAGLELAAQAVPAGLVAALAGLSLVVLRGRGRRVVGVVLAVVGLAATAVLAAGTVAAAGQPGVLTPAPWVALAGALAIGAAGVVAWRRPAPPPVLGERYSLEGEAAGDDEWELGSDER